MTTKQEKGSSTVEMKVEKKRGRKIDPNSKRQAYLKEKAERDVIRAQKRAEKAAELAKKTVSKEGKRASKATAKK